MIKRNLRVHQAVATLKPIIRFILMEAKQQSVTIWTASVTLVNLNIVLFIILQLHHKPAHSLILTYALQYCRSYVSEASDQMFLLTAVLCVCSCHSVVTERHAEV